MSEPNPARPHIPTTTADDHDLWMARLTELNEYDVDELLAGRTRPGHMDLDPLADLALALRAQAATESVPAMGPALRLALADAPASTARLHGRFRQRLAGLTAAGVGIVAFGAASAADALPAPVQRVVADAGGLVGVELPDPDDDDEVVDAGDNRNKDAGGSNAGGAQGAEAQDGGGPPGTTPGGATPADPGTPGDHEPATPAIPPEHSNGGNDNGTGPDAESDGVTLPGIATDHTKVKAPKD